VTPAYSVVHIWIPRFLWLQLSVWLQLSGPDSYSHTNLIHLVKVIRKNMLNFIFTPFCFSQSLWSLSVHHIQLTSVVNFLQWSLLGQIGVSILESASNILETVSIFINPWWWKWRTVSKRVDSNSILTQPAVWGDFTACSYNEGLKSYILHLFFAHKWGWNPQFQQM
jgi:hypothetical protein